MAAATESSELLHLFDLNWFTNQTPNLKSSNTNSQNPLHQINHIKTQKNPNPRSLSEQSLSTESSSSFIGSDTASPNSVLINPNPHFPSRTDRKVKCKPESKRKQSQMRRKGSRGDEGSSKSLSELEFEELKGFMDLGFVFDEEEIDSRLVSIVPGVQRLGERKQGMVQKDHDENKVVVSRPYLSEAWEAMERRDPVVDLRVKNLSDEIDVKNRLRVWAHSVATSAMRV